MPVDNLKVRAGLLCQLCKAAVRNEIIPLRADQCICQLIRISTDVFDIGLFCDINTVQTLFF